MSRQTREKTEEFEVKKGPRQSLRILTLNAFLVDWITAKFKFMTTCVRQTERATDIGQLIQKESFDLILMQEMWGSDLEIFEKAVGPEYCIEECQRGYNFTSGTFMNLLNSASSWANSNGGLMTVWKKRILGRQNFWKHTFSVSESSSRKGVTAHLFSLENSPYSVLACNTHLDPMHFEYQLQQCQQIHEFITKIVKDELSGHKDFDPSKLVVILAGDFNIDGNNFTKYSKMINALTGAPNVNLLRNNNSEQAHSSTVIKDLMKEYDPSLAAIPTYSHSKNSLVQWEEEFRIDYLFSFDSIATIQLAPAKLQSASIETQDKGKELSDHFPLFWDLVFGQ